VPSRIRFIRLWGLECGSTGVGEELAVGGVRDPALEAAHGLQPGLALGELAPVVGAAFSVEADLGGCGDPASGGTVSTAAGQDQTQPQPRRTPR
jgi:hypothetical protein